MGSCPNPVGSSPSPSWPWSLPSLARRTCWCEGVPQAWRAASPSPSATSGATADARQRHRLRAGECNREPSATAEPTPDTHAHDRAGHVSPRARPGDLSSPGRNSSPHVNEDRSTVEGLNGALTERRRGAGRRRGSDGVGRHPRFRRRRARLAARPPAGRLLRGGPRRGERHARRVRDRRRAVHRLDRRPVAGSPACRRSALRSMRPTTARAAFTTFVAALEGTTCPT